MSSFTAILTKSIIVLLIAVAAEVIVMLVAKVISRNITHSVGQQERPTSIKARRRSTLQGLLVNSARYFIYFIALLMILGQLGINWQPILAGAGVIGLAIGFGAQRLVRDIISGLFILVEDQFAIGDYVTLGAVSGEVVELGLRVTKIRDDNGRICTVANGDVIATCNYSRGPYRLTINFAVPADSDLVRVREAVNAMAEDFSGREDVSGKPCLIGPTDISAGKLQLLLTADVTSANRLSLAAEIQTVLLHRLRNIGISIC
ncbi:MAG: mechanosensitive ion channel family protein [bacterium]|nr:mechanosensitive ion channel family protein [bacterium]